MNTAADAVSPAACSVPDIFLSTLHGLTHLILKIVP